MSAATTTPDTDPVVAQAQEYAQKLLLLSEGSVNRHFDPFEDIDWENPDFDADTKPERWILPQSADPLGRHPWYLALSDEQKIAVGKYRQSNVAKVGLQFEAILISGMMQHVFGLPNGSPEFRYCSHEMIEEHNHTLMFQEMVNRIGIDVPGMGPLVRQLRHLAVPVAVLAPNLFFMAVLAGEEPIDHIQKDILRSGEDVHPIMRGVMAIHVAEEARHISFAHEFLKQHVPEGNAANRFVLSIAMPIIMWILGRAIATPPRSFFDEFDIPESVRKELFYGSKEAKQVFSDYFADVRSLAKEIGLMNPISKRVWKLLGIDGHSTRYRSEPLRVVGKAA
ncbi:AurF N-oxygenase family protein [Nocardia cyriacigeorgica]|uniref:AurF N-oxygenase family protein n=1 Tax=Nocardia cyriacigeorgica TaxID=135487 RepID=UPI0013D7A40A|nr:diiron oxygenase [Nocardia cyriacigeorgica]MBF6439781.1 diiron oxygenase [Nocardia cyriacigeorgica]MBF6455810.1 diiron oxygenase [Nocardia cyriacigeorgica]MBF6477703.1 diiron oxygenase [Nocardia cyriacigeorgica]MBF6553449.1 diiron oxygenase [Nocardia cyriacigeorgica]NEW28093.1 diiron oxygenase [Nocardia cyriacigeorgica]